MSFFNASPTLIKVIDYLVNVDVGTFIAEWGSKWIRGGCILNSTDIWYLDSYTRNKCFILTETKLYLVHRALFSLDLFETLDLHDYRSFDITDKRVDWTDLIVILKNESTKLDSIL